MAEVRCVFSIWNNRGDRGVGLVYRMGRRMEYLGTMSLFLS